MGSSFEDRNEDECLLENNNRAPSISKGVKDENVFLLTQQ
jgi:hypothetical protein